MACDCSGIEQPAINCFSVGEIRSRRGSAAAAALTIVDEPTEPEQTNSRVGPYLERPEGPRDSMEKFPYQVRGKNRTIESNWDKLCASAPGNARNCFDHLARTP